MLKAEIEPDQGFYLLISQPIYMNIVIYNEDQHVKSCCSFNPIQEKRASDLAGEDGRARELIGGS